MSGRHDTNNTVPPRAYGTRKWTGSAQAHSRTERGKIIERTVPGHDLLQKQAASLLSGERDPIANAANLAALLYHALPDVNWAGFYFVRGDELVLGPFQGKTACTRIAFGRGVCGAAWQRRATVVVADVHAFDGHIACDVASNAEIVVPIVTPGGDIAGVLDVDSPAVDRFRDDDRRLLEAIVAEFVRASDLERAIYREKGG